MGEVKNQSKKCHVLFEWPLINSRLKSVFLNFNGSIYSARRLIGSRIIESAAYCNQKLPAHLYIYSTQNTSVNWIIRLLLSLLCWLKVILLSGGHCIFIFIIFSGFFPVAINFLRRIPVIGTLLNLPGISSVNRFACFLTLKLLRQQYF
jgi:hypothetical protein